jgi:hypothetical protein
LTGCAYTLYIAAYLAVTWNTWLPSVTPRLDISVAIRDIAIANAGLYRFEGYTLITPIST